MRRSLPIRGILILLISVLMPATVARPIPAVAQGALKEYRSDVFGLAFQYPSDWGIREQLVTQTILAASEADLKAIGESQKPAGLIFSITITSMRQIGARSLDDFGGLLGRISGEATRPITNIRVGGADGLVTAMTSSAQDVATQTAILSIGKRRVAIIRGVATATGWVTGGKMQFEAILNTMSFFPPPNGIDIDGVGTAFWQLSASDVGLLDLTDISISVDGSTLYVTERSKGVWEISANGISRGITRPPEVGAFGGVVVLRDGSRYFTDPVNHVLWLSLPTEPAMRKLGRGEVGAGRGAFGPNSPSQFGFAPRYIYILDENESGPRIQLFSFTGVPQTFWRLPAGIENPRMAIDGDGNAYILGKNTNGIIKVNAAGAVSEDRIATDILANSEILGLAMDRFDNFFVATADQGILHLNGDGRLIGVIGEPYDESAPPKPGQLARPIAMALTPGGGPMYVVDAGSKYPQIVAFALDGNTAVSLEAGTRDGGVITDGQTVSGSIAVATFLYTYTFDGKAGEVVTITMQGGDKIDAYVDLLRPDGKLAAANDDAKVSGLAAKDAQIKEFVLPADGTYTIRATRFGREASRQVGDFTLKLEKVR
jgi:hypothetical protein